MKSFSKLDDNQLLNINLVSKQFKDIYNEYFVDFLKNILTNKGIYVNNLKCKKRLKDIYKYKHLNQKISIESRNGWKKIIAGTNGKIYMVSSYSYINGFYDVGPNIIETSLILCDVKDIISISIVIYEFVFLRNDGNVYCYNSQIDSTPYLLCKLNGKFLSNIVSIHAFNDCSLFLSSKGKVYKRNYNVKYAELIPYLKNIVQITGNRNIKLFLTKDGHIFKNNEKLDTFNNIKCVAVSYSGEMMTLSKDNILMRGEVQIALNINKFSFSGMGLTVLGNDRNLINYPMAQNKYLLDKNILDFCRDSFDICTLSTDDKFIIYDPHDKPYNININGKISMLGFKLILVDNKLYYIRDIVRGSYDIVEHRLLEVI